MNECEGSKEILLLIIKMCHFLLRFLKLNSQSKKKSWLLVSQKKHCNQLNFFTLLSILKNEILQILTNKSFISS